ncbi:MAG: class I SAM-dependent methyltransferase [Acidimicrobiales bacterium]
MSVAAAAGHRAKPGRWLYDACPICGATIGADRTSPPVENRDGDAVEFRICDRCWTLIPSDTDATGDELDETARQADYHAELWDDVNYEQLDLLAAGAMQLAWEFAESLGEPGSQGTIVDIGAGRGNILHAVRRLGYDVRGCEPSPGLTAIGRSAYLLGPEILENVDAEHFLRRLGSGDRPISGFIIWHVLEHLQNPVPLLRRCLEIAPDPQVFIELPLAIAEDIFPEHLFFPTPRTLLWLAEEHQLNIQLLQVTEDQRLRVFYSRQPVVMQPQAVGAIEDLEEVYRTMSPAFEFFASGVIDHVGIG